MSANAVPTQMAQFSHRVRQSGHGRRDPKIPTLIYLHEDQWFALHTVAATQGFPSPDLYLQHVVNQLANDLALAVEGGTPEIACPDDLEQDLGEQLKGIG